MNDDPALQSLDGPDEEAVLGIDNIAIDLPIAGVGSRSLAAFIDYLLLSVVFLLTFTLGALLFTQLFEDTVWLVVAFSFLSFLLYWGYFLTAELVTNGKTPGKAVMGLQVVGRSGGQAGSRQIVLRNLVRPVDILIGLPLMALDPLARRLGDRLGGTLVVHRRPVRGGPGLGRIPRGWSHREVAVAESLLARQGEMEILQSRSIALRLIELVRQAEPELLEGGPDPGEDPLAALSQALAVGEESAAGPSEDREPENREGGR
jgi:uncharacterized RDD family membrane protein YckC